MRLERGIRRTPTGFHVYVRKAGVYRAKRFPLDTPITTLREWRESRITPQAEPAPRGPYRRFTDDADAYLALVTGLASYQDRKYRIAQWVKALGPDTDRKTVTALEIRRVLESWRRQGLSHGSLNLRRTALMHLFTVLDGKSAPNPVRDVPPYKELVKPLSLPAWADAEKAVERVGWVTNKDGKGRRKNLTRLRLQVLLYTGWPASTLMRVEPSHVNWEDGSVRLTARRKGKGVPGRTVPLLPKALAALKALKAAKAFGPFETHSMNKALRRACRALKMPEFHPYVLRHLFLTELALATRDDRVVAEVGLHADTRLTRRYTQQSVDPRITDGLATLATRLSAHVGFQPETAPPDRRKSKTGKTQKTATKGRI